MERHPAPHGFDRYPSAGLLRRIGVLAEGWVTASEIVGDPQTASGVRGTRLLVPMLDTVRKVTGLDADLLEQDEETGSFRLVLVDAYGEPAGVVTRARATWRQSPQIFGGSQSWEIGPDWEVHVDTKSGDHQAASRLHEALRRVLPTE